MAVWDTKRILNGRSNKGAINAEVPPRVLASDHDMRELRLRKLKSG
jgi:hypothetical protein